jgi:hypothetical protein
MSWRLCWTSNHYLGRPCYTSKRYCQHPKVCSILFSRRCFTPVRRRTQKLRWSALAVDLSLPRVHNPQEEYSWIQRSIRLWLDEEWQPQSVHEKIGEEAAKLYLKLREQGEDHLGSLVLGLSLELEKVDFQDAFVDSFTVANKVAELLMEKLVECGDENSSTSETRTDPTPTAEDFELVCKAKSSGFERYQFLSKILEESLSDSTVHAAVLICLGYQWEGGEWRPKTVDKQTLCCFEDNCRNFDILHNDYVLAFLERQLPEEEDKRKDLDEFINQLAGKNGVLERFVYLLQYFR